jgi:hypothetical protein
MKKNISLSRVTYAVLFLSPLMLTSCQGPGLGGLFGGPPPMEQQGPGAEIYSYPEETGQHHGKAAIRSHSHSSAVSSERKHAGPLTHRRAHRETHVPTKAPTVHRMRASHSSSTSSSTSSSPASSSADSKSSENKISGTTPVTVPVSPATPTVAPTAVPSSPPPSTPPPTVGQ